MGRGGRSGGGGSHHSSGGGHRSSSSRSGSSHSFSSSGRAGRGSSSGFRGSSSGSGFRGSSGGTSFHHTSIHGNNGYAPHGTYYSRGPARRGSTLSAVIALVVVFFIMGLMLVAITSGSSSGITKNTTNRDKLELGYGYTNVNTYDELGWLHNTSRMNKDLKEFYDDTGAVPYIALIDRPDLCMSSDAVQREYADQWYSEHLDHEGYILLLYFSSGTEEYGTDGECQLICGKQAAFLFDGEAQDIFWDCLDHYWFSDCDEDELFTKAFVDTGNRIMQRPTSGADAIKSLAPVIIIVVLVTALIVLMTIKRKHEAERAAETERILSQPLRRQQSAQRTEEDDLLDQYGDSDE